MEKKKLKGKGFHSLIAVGEVGEGLEAHSILGTADEGGAHPSPFASLSFSDSKKVHIYCLVDRRRFLVVGWRNTVRSHDHPSVSNYSTTAPM